MRTDHGQQYAALRDLGVELLGKIDAGFHGVDVHEEIVFGEPCRQIIEQPAGHSGGVIAAIIDEDAGHDGL